ncbi:MAG: MotA/TolQ/ExbB proton channel family protein [Bacteroidota bacterium]|nr:MotA/TolQ/ExbB proton channel family protein [Bacteroidota bacterium]
MIPGLILEAANVVKDTLATAAAQLQTIAQTPKVNSLTLWDLIIKGGVIMIPILLLSFLAVYFFVERFIAIRKASKEETNFMSTIKDFIIDGKLDTAKEFCKQTNSPVSRMVEKGIARIGRPLNEIERTLESHGNFEVSKLERNLKILGIVAGIAPMLGFIGTIMGVIKIFYNMSLQDNISIGVISSGLYEKMITSASGLIIGVLAFIGYHYLNILLDKVVFKLENNAIDFVDLLQKEA